MPASNKETAVSFLKLASSGSAIEAFAKYIAPDFRHHNPYFEGSAEALKSAMQQNAKANPNKVFEIKHAITDGNLVVVHSHVRLKPAAPGVAVVHIFRFERGRIAELWDLGQAIPGESPNQYGMF